MHFDVQSLIAGALVLLAASYVIARVVRLLRAAPQQGCGASCAGCPSSAGEKSALVHIAPLKREPG
jgi:hypothetical protein